VKRAQLVCLTVVLGVASPTIRAQSPQVVAPIVITTLLASYDEAPATPDADDPAVWIDRRNPRRSLIIGTAKDAGLLVYDLAGRLRQAIRPPNAPHVSADDPPTPAKHSAGSTTWISPTTFGWAATLVPSAPTSRWYRTVVAIASGSTQSTRRRPTVRSSTSRHQTFRGCSAAL
jgi:Phytase